MLLVLLNLLLVSMMDCLDLIIQQVHTLLIRIHLGLQGLQIFAQALILLAQVRDRGTDSFPAHLLLIEPRKDICIP